MQQNQRHSSKKQNWITPPWIIEAATTVLGGIDLDPASTARANEAVQAFLYFTQEWDGLTRPWCNRPPTSIWLNPPGGWHNGVWGDSEIRHWWAKTLVEREQKYFGHMLWLAFSIEQHQVTQVKFPLSLLDFPTCTFRNRVSYIDDITGKPVSGMTHSSSITYIPGSKDETELFASVFEQFGKVVVPIRGSPRKVLAMPENKIHNVPAALPDERACLTCRHQVTATSPDEGGWCVVPAVANGTITCGCKCKLPVAPMIL